MELEEDPEKLKLRHLRKGSPPAAARIREGVELLLQLSENDKAYSIAAVGRNCCSGEDVLLDRTTSRQEVTGKQKENTLDETVPSPSSSPASSLSSYCRASRGATGKAEMQSRTLKIGFGIKGKK